MSYHVHVSPDAGGALSPEDTGIFPVLEPLPEAEGDAEPARRVVPELWLIAGGTIVAMIAAFVAFTASSPPVHAMPSPFSPAPTSISHAPQAPAATCVPVQ